jgi:hypothetical protein
MKPPHSRKPQLSSASSSRLRPTAPRFVPPRRKNTTAITSKNNSGIIQKYNIRINLTQARSDPHQADATDFQMRKKPTAIY